MENVICLLMDKNSFFAKSIVKPGTKILTIVPISEDTADGIVLETERIPIAVSPTKRFAISKSNASSNMLPKELIEFHIPDKKISLMCTKLNKCLLTFNWGVNFFVYQ